MTLKELPLELDTLIQVYSLLTWCSEPQFLPLLNGDDNADFAEL